MTQRVPFLRHWIVLQHGKLTAVRTEAEARLVL
jgi:hypothetical protein